MKYILALVFSFALLAALPLVPRAEDIVLEGGRGTESHPLGNPSSTPPTTEELEEALGSTFEEPAFPWGSYPLYDLNTSDLKFFPYFVRFKRKVEKEWEYPIDSQISREEGELTLLVDISKHGRVDGVVVADSAPYQRLNDEAVRAVRMAEPFPPLPSDWGLEGIRIRAKFSYVLDPWWEKGDGAAMSMRGEAPSFAEIRAAILGRFEKHAVINEEDFEVN